MKAFVLAGAISQAELIKELKGRGIYTILADRNPSAFAVPFADKFYPVSTSDIEKIREIAINEKVDFIITACADQVLLVVAQISEELGLPFYLNYETAKLVSDKQYMKEVFVKNNIPTAKYIALKSLDLDKIKDFEYPLIVKPVDCYSSRGVKKVFNVKELEVAFNDAIKLSKNKTAIVEEYCDGLEITVDVYVENKKAKLLTTSLSEKISDNNKFVIYRTKNPAPISEEIKGEIVVIAQKLADAFNLTDCPMLIQVITDGKKINVLEFCARTGGCIKYELIKKMTGFDVIKAAVDLSLGKKPHVGKIKSESKYLTNTYLYCNKGIFDHLEGFEKLFKDGIISSYHQFVQKNAEFEYVSSSGDRVGAFTVQSNDLDDLNKKYAIAKDCIKAIDCDGNDIIRHDLIKELFWEEKLI